MTRRQLDRARRLLCRLQDQIRAATLAARRRAGARMARIAAVTPADTIYAIDRIGEEQVLRWFRREWPRDWPVEIVMEGLEDTPTTIPEGTPVTGTIWKCLIDPIDGTRGFMYDKRSAWSLAALAPQRGPATSLAHIVVAAMTELPVAKAGWADQLSAVKGGGVRAERLALGPGRRKPLSVRPSTATNLAHGFASFAKFFPAGKAWLAALEEKLWTELGTGPDVFDDQYLSTGGQLYELMMGHDRFVADIRPLAFARLGIGSALACHPYDICTALIAREAGCIITDPQGKSLDALLDTTTAVAWIGYANRSLARRIAPALRRLLKPPVN